jgi:purine-binding chemotaxis protein CheW
MILGVKRMSEENDHLLKDKEITKAVLQLRAKDLATQKEENKISGDSIEVVVFILSNEKYALELNFVREVYPLKDLTPLPCTPTFVSGIINVRSQIVSIIDLKKFFDLNDHTDDHNQRVIILHSKQMEFGILADEIVGVQSIPVKTIQMSMLTLQGIGADYIKGVTEKRTVILDAEKILTDSKIIVHEELKE